MNNQETIRDEIDYVLPPDLRSVWITVDGFSVYVRRCDEGVGIDVYPLDNEDDDEALASTCAYTVDLPEKEEP